MGIGIVTVRRAVCWAEVLLCEFILNFRLIGHVFCRTCLRQLRQPVCPLCREAFDDEFLLSKVMRKVHVEFPNAGTSRNRSHEDESDPEVGRRARHLESRVAEMVLQSQLNISQASELHSEVSRFLREQPRGEVRCTKRCYDHWN